MYLVCFSELLVGCKDTTRSKSTKYETMSFINSEMARENGKVAGFRNMKRI